MTVNIITEELLQDIRMKSHLECETIPDVEERYKYEAGTEKRDEVSRSIIRAVATARGVLVRFLEPDFSDFASNLPEIPEEFCFQFHISERRLAGRTQQIADRLHSYIVDLTLGYYYTSCNKLDFAKTHTDMAAGECMQIESLLYTKLPPIFKF